MRKFFTGIMTGLLLCAVCAQAADPIIADLTLRGGKVWKVALFGKDESGNIEVLQQGGSQKLKVPAAMIGRLDFKLSFNQKELAGGYQEGNFGDVVTALKDGLEPLYAYISVENNFMPYMAVLVKAAYWDGDYQVASDALSRMLPSLKDDAMRSELLRFRGLNLLGKNDVNGADEVVKELGIGLDGKGQSPLDWYLLAKVRRAQKKMLDAQEACANIIAFSARDFEWMAPGLYLMAELYGEAGRYTAAEQALKELDTIYSAPYWSERSAVYRKELKDREIKEFENRNAVKE